MEGAHTDVVSLLLNSGADPHATTTDSGNSPLIIAAMAGHTGHPTAD